MFILKSKYNKLLEELGRKERLISGLEISLNLYQSKLKDLELGNESNKEYTKICPLTYKVYSLMPSILTKNKELSEESKFNESKVIKTTPTIMKHL